MPLQVISGGSVLGRLLRGAMALGLLAGGATWVSAGEPAKELKGLPLVFQDDFESGKLDHWEASDPAAWKIITQGQNHVLSQFQPSKVKTPVRSPFNRTMVKGIEVGDFVLDVKLQSTVKDYGHRDMCLFFGYTDPAHFYYVHIAKKADDRANQIFIVNNADRKKISLESTAGTDWTDNWHHARVVRSVKTGSIEVFFDNMDKPIMRAEDKTFLRGQVGIGNFDDLGNYDNVLLYGEKLSK